MKKFILSLTLILTVAFGAVLTVARPAPLSARAETDVTIEESASSVSLDELVDTSKFEKIEVGDDLSNKTIYRTKPESDVLVNSLKYGIFFGGDEVYYGELSQENVLEDYETDFSSTKVLGFVKNSGLDFDAFWAEYPVLEYKITGDFGEVTKLDLSSGDLYVAIESKESSEILEDVSVGDPLCDVWYKVDFTILNTEDKLSATEILRWNDGMTKVKYVNGEIVFFTSYTFSLFEVSGTIYSILDGNYLYFYIPIGTKLVHPTNTSYNEVLGSETVISSAMADIKKVAPLAWLDSETVYTSDDLNNPDMFKLIEVGDVIKKNDVFVVFNNVAPVVCVTSEKYFIVAHYSINNATLYVGEFIVPGTQIDGANLTTFLLSFRTQTKNVVEYPFQCVGSSNYNNGSLKILCDFGEVTNVYDGGAAEYITTFSVEEPEPDEPTSKPEDESTSESAIEDDSQKFIDKTTAWINDNLGLSLTSSFVGAVLLVLIVSFFVNRAKK